MESLFSPAPPSPSTAQTPTTDFALLESQKENIRPLATGRSAVTLSSLFVKQSSEKVGDGHAVFQRDIEEAERRDKEGEDMIDGIQDVLDAYHRYILFVIQHHPSSANHLLPLLESTTRRFLTDARYAQDARYLKLWAMYTHHVERREEIWSFLESRDVGTRHSVFYEEWALAAEALGRKKKADDVFRLGIARKALPLERLKARHQAFLARILVPPNGTVPDDAPLPAVAPGRSILGSTSTLSTPRIAGLTVTDPTPRQSTRNPNGFKMEIFSDEKGANEDSSAGPWADLGTRDGRRKENVVEAGPWKGEVLPQSAARNRIAPRTPKVEVFKDEQGGADAVWNAEDVFARSKNPLSEAELLKSDPLRMYDTSTLSTTIPSLPAPPVRKAPSRPPSALASSTSSSGYIKQPWECPTDGPDVVGGNGKLERRMFDWNAVYRNKEEWSFEEIRARERGLLGKDYKDVKDWETDWHKPGCMSLFRLELMKASTPRGEKKKSMPSPTVNTKLADEDVRGMFNQTIGVGHQDSDEESDSSESDEEEATDVVQPLPTPLPTRPTMLAPTGFVPPTPTPASGHVTQNRLFAQPKIIEPYVDENALPAIKGFNVFEQTPGKTPGRTPLGVKPKPFEIFAEDPIPEEVESITVPEEVNIFATPALAEKRSYRPAPFRPTLQEESAEPKGYSLFEPAEEGYAIAEEEEDEDERELPGRRLKHFGGIHEMTPITERTCEFTQFTTRSSLGPGSKIGIVEGDSPLTLATGGLSPIDEGRSGLERLSLDSEGDGKDSCSGLMPGFSLPEGYTIGRQEVTQTMVLVDAANTMSASVKPEGNAIPNPCNPSDDNIVSAMLAQISPPLSNISGFMDLRLTSSNQLEKLNKSTKSNQRRGSASSSRASLAPEQGYALTLQNRQFEVKEKLGEGGFGAVFLAVDLAVRQAQDDADSDDEDDEDRSLLAVKVENPSSVWEFVMLSRIHSRISADIRRSIIMAHGLYAYQDESYLLVDYMTQGTLLDVVNKAGTIGIAPSTAGSSGGVDEMIAIFFTIELLKILEELHSTQIIHGDLKIDNCLIRLEDIPASSGGNSAWSTTYSPTGSDGWNHKGLKLIDFGRSIDLSLYEAGNEQRFLADWKVDEKDCVEMREGKEWSWETDYFGVAGVCYCMLFGKYISTDHDGSGKYKIDAPLKRYWQTDLWNDLFDTLLNPRSAGNGILPITDTLVVIRQGFESWLEENCMRNGKNLKAMLKKIELAAMVRKG